MKKLILCTLTLLGAMNLSMAQTEMKTIFGSKEGQKVKVDGFGSMDFMVSKVIDQESMQIGAHGGIILNKKLMLGAGGYGIVTQHKFDGVFPQQPLNLYGGYGGLLIGFNVAPREAIHASFPVIIGAGGIDIADRDFFPNAGPEFEEYIIESSAFFVIHPMANIEINMTKFFRLAAGVGYRHVSGTDLVNIKDEDLTSWTANVSFKFGGF